MLPIFELPAHHADSTAVAQGDWSCEIHVHDDGQPLVEAPLEVGQANGWRRRLDLEHQRAAYHAAIEATREEAIAEAERVRLAEEAAKNKVPPDTISVPSGKEVDGAAAQPPSPTPDTPEASVEPVRADRAPDAPADTAPSTPALREDLTPADLIAAGDSGKDLPAAEQVAESVVDSARSLVTSAVDRIRNRKK